VRRWVRLASRFVIDRRRKRIRGHRALRPVVLCGAMLAPALLAGGLLVAELTGYEAAVQRADAGAEPVGPGEIEEGGRGGGVREAERAREAEQLGEAAGAGEAERSGEAGSAEEAEEGGEVERFDDGEAIWVGGGERRGFREEGGGAWRGTASRLRAGEPVESLNDEPQDEPQGVAGTLAEAETPAVAGTPTAVGTPREAGTPQESERPREARAPEEAVAVVPVMVGSVRSRVFGPRLMPPPLRPERVYGGWMPVAAKSRVRGTGPGEAGWPSVPGGTDGANEADVVVPITPRPQASRGPRKVASPPPVASESRVRRTQPLARPEPRDGCSAEWKGTWLWRVCKKQARQEV